MKADQSADMHFRSLVAFLLALLSGLGLVAGSTLGVFATPANAGVITNIITATSSFTPTPSPTGSGEPERAIPQSSTGATTTTATDTPIATPTCPPLGTWNLVTSPNPSAYTNYLFAVAALASDDAWAVGYSLASSGS